MAAVGGLGYLPIAARRIGGSVPAAVTDVIIIVIIVITITVTDLTTTAAAAAAVNPLMGTLKQQSDGPLYSNTVMLYTGR